MKFALIRCPQIFGKYVTAAPAVPPIGLGYVAASLLEAGHEVQVIDTTGEAIDEFKSMGGAILRRGLSDDQILERLDAPEVIGFSLMFSQDWLVTRTLIEKVHAAFPDATLIAGGEHLSAEPVGALQESPGLDFVVTGEGDQVVCDLAEHIEGRKPIEDVGGVYYRDGDEIRLSSGMTRLRDIDKLPWPAWDLFPIHNYLDGGYGWGVDRGRNMPITATRGCPYQCTFCSNPTMWTTRWTARSPEDTVKEIEYYMDKYQATNFDFQDLTAILKKDWIVKFANLLIEKDLNIYWQLPTGTRSEALDEEVLPLLVASGCSNITYAPESGTQSVLKKIKKKIDTDKMLVSIRAAVKAGCNVKANFIMGFPGDTYGIYLESFGFLAKAAMAGVHDISVAPFRPYPGSELFRDLQKQGVLPDPLTDEYYRELFITSDNVPGSTMASAECFTEHMSTKGLNRLRYAALLWFFAISWLIRPQRVFTLIKNVVTNKQDSRLDKSLIEMKQRVLKSWKGKEGLAVGKINPY